MLTTAAGSSAPQAPQGASTLGAFDDAMSEIYASIAALRQGDVEAAQGDVATNDAVHERQAAAERAAIQQEQANAADSGGGFFSSIGHLVGDVVSDLAHGDVGDAVHDAGRDLDAAWNSPRFWSDLELGLKDVAVVAAAASAIVLTAGAAGVALGAGIVATATVVGATAGAGAALAGVRTGQFAANAEDASANATAATNRMGELQELTENVLADLEATDKSHGRSLQALTQAMQTNDDTTVAPATMTVKG